MVAAPVIAVLDPELIILGGPIGIAGGDELADLGRRATRSRLCAAHANREPSPSRTEPAAFSSTASGIFSSDAINTASP